METLAQSMTPSVAMNTIAKLERSEMGLTLDYMIQVAKVLCVSVCSLVPGDHREATANSAGLRNALVVPLRSDLQVEVLNLPFDLTASEGKRLANVVAGFARPAG